MNASIVGSYLDSITLAGREKNDNSFSVYALVRVCDIIAGNGALHHRAYRPFYIEI